MNNKKIEVVVSYYPLRKENEKNYSISAFNDLNGETSLDEVLRILMESVEEINRIHNGEKPAPEWEDLN